MPEIQYKEQSGILHIGGGRFFYAQQPVEVSVDEKDKLLETYTDLELVNDQSNGNDENTEGDLHNESSLKTLKADEQKALIIDLGGDPEQTKNEGDRIALIIELQNQQGK